MGRSDWTPVAAKHTFKHLNSSVNSINLLDYNNLNNDEGRDISSQNNSREVDKVTEVQIPSSQKQDHEILTLKKIPSKVSPASHHKLEVSFCMPHKGNQLRDKGNQVPHPVPQV